jgi:hypothetical protein
MIIFKKGRDNLSHYVSSVEIILAGWINLNVRAVKFSF